ncbi:MAG: gluconate 2-dehydrogenase subunit 3 family protein [Acidobacteriaceae bacterium]
MEESIGQNRELRFQRRTMLRMMIAVPIAGLVPLSSFAAQAGNALPGASVLPESPDAYQPRILSPHELKTVQVLSDWIIPADGVSGSATDAGVPEFIDDWLDYQRGYQLDNIRSGLAWLDAECGRRNFRSFVNCAPEEQKRMLDRIAYPQKAAAEDARGVVFFNLMRDLVLSGFYTSEMGMRDLPYVGNEPQSEWQGCPTPVLSRLGLAT